MFRLFDCESGEMVQEFVDSGDILCIRASRDGSFIVYGNDRGRLKIRNIHDGRVIHDIEPAHANNYVRCCDIADNMSFCVTICFFFC